MMYYIDERKNPQMLKYLQVFVYLKCYGCGDVYRFANFESALNAYKHDVNKCVKCAPRNSYTKHNITYRSKEVK